jgi:hypothetical protein
VSTRANLGWAAGLIFSAVLAVGPAHAATINAASPALTDVASAIALASDGDTVIIPAGTANWNSTLTITKGITLQGATTVTGDHTTAMSATDGTVILDTVVGASGSPPLIQATLSNPSSFRITGLTFQYDPNVTTKNQTGAVIIGGSCSNFRLDHCHFNRLYGFHLMVNDMFGVIDHTIFDVRSGTNEMINISHPHYAPPGDKNSYLHGDGSWIDTAQFGTGRFLFLEDVTDTSYGTTSTDGVIDSLFGGGRWVARYCTFNNTRALGGHGTESSGRARGCRSVEAYNNNFVITSNFDLGIARSGSRLYYNNTYAYTTGYVPYTPPVVCYRELTPFQYWAGASGNSAWDYNDTTDHSGNGLGGGSNGLYGSGTDNSGVTGHTYLTDTTKSWTANQWNGYMIQNLDQLVSGYPYCAFITGNDAHTIQYALGGSTIGASSTPLTFNSGNRYQIYKVLVALDQGGRGKGDLLSGTQPLNNGAIGWAHQILDPLYSWNNKIGTTLANATLKAKWFTDGQGFPGLNENREFYNQNAAWTAGQPLTTGVGVGPVANLPTQCTPGTDTTGVTTNPPGVGYWATDTNTLYVCTAPNTWGPYYRPYVYPHPLVSSVPAPPGNLRILP